MINKIEKLNKMQKNTRCNRGLLCREGELSSASGFSFAFLIWHKGYARLLMRWVISHSEYINF